MCLFELVNGHIPHYDEARASSAKGAPQGVNGARAMFLIGTGAHPLCRSLLFFCACLLFDNDAMWQVWRPRLTTRASGRRTRRTSSAR